MTEIVYGAEQGKRYEIVETGKVGEYTYEIGNNRGTYPFVNCLNVMGFLVSQWTYTNEGDALGDYRDGKRWTLDEIRQDVCTFLSSLL